MKKHTSGKWFAAGPSVLGGDGPTFRQICVISDDRKSGEEPVANSNLVCASPDMLAILRTAIDEIQDHIEEANLPDDDKHPLAPLRFRMKSVVAKAEMRVR